MEVLLALWRQKSWKLRLVFFQTSPSEEENYDVSGKQETKHQVETEYLVFWDDSEQDLGCPPPVEGLMASQRDHSSVMVSSL